MVEERRRKHSLETGFEVTLMILFDLHLSWLKKTFYYFSSVWWYSVSNVSARKSLRLLCPIADLFFSLYRPRQRWSDCRGTIVSIHPNSPCAHQPCWRLTCQRREDCAQAQHHPLQWRGNDHRHHHRLWHFCHSNRCGQRNWLSWALPDRLVCLWSNLDHGCPVLCRAGHNHHQVRGRLHLHPGGVWWTGGLSKTVGGDAYHPAIITVCGVSGVRHLSAETTLPKLHRARQCCQAHCLPLSQWVGFVVCRNFAKDNWENVKLHVLKFTDDSSHNSWLYCILFSFPDVRELYQCESGHQGPGLVHSLQIAGPHHHHPLWFYPDFYRWVQATDSLTKLHAWVYRQLVSVLQYLHSYITLQL